MIYNLLCNEISVVGGGINFYCYGDNDDLLISVHMVKSALAAYIAICCKENPQNKYKIGDQGTVEECEGTEMVVIFKKGNNTFVGGGNANSVGNDLSVFVKKLSDK